MNTCIIQLLPENEIEKNLLTTSPDEDTFLFHYTHALEKYIDKDAVFLSIENSDHYPQQVVVKFKIAKGIGE